MNRTSAIRRIASDGVINGLLMVLGGIIVARPNLWNWAAGFQYLAHMIGQSGVTLVLLAAGFLGSAILVRRRWPITCQFLAAVGFFTMLIPVLMSLVVGEPDAMGLTGTLFTFGFVLFFGGCSAYLAGRFFPVRAEKPLPGGDEKSQRSTA